MAEHNEQEAKGSHPLCKPLRHACANVIGVLPDRYLKHQMHKQCSCAAAHDLGNCVCTGVYPGQTPPEGFDDGDCGVEVRPADGA